MHFLIFSAFDPIPSDGVPPLRYARLAEELLQRGHKVTYVTASFFHLHHRQRAGKQWAGKGNPANLQLELIAVPSYETNAGLARFRFFSSLAKGLKALLSRLCEKPDLVLAASPPLRAANVLLQWAKKNKIPSVLDIQDAWPEAWEQFIPKFIPAKLVLWPLYRMAGENARLAGALCSVSADYLETYAFTKPKAVFHLGSFSYSQKVAADSEPWTIAYAGNASHNKALSDAIDVIGKMPGVCLRIIEVGKSNSHYHEEATSYSNITFEPLKEMRDLPDLLSECQAGLLLVNPESHIAFPNKAFAYWASGLPVISNIRGGELEKLIEKNSLGLSVDAGEAGFLQQALDFCRQSFHQEDRLRIQDFARKELNSDFIYKSYADWLSDLAKKI